MSCSLRALALTVVLCGAVICAQGRKLHQYGYGTPATPSTVTPAPMDMETGMGMPDMHMDYNDTYTIDWKIPAANEPYPMYNASLGDMFYWTWTGVHGLYGMPNSTCPTSWDNLGAEYEEYSAPVTGGSYNWTADMPGINWFACPVSGHCDAGMKMAVNVSMPTYNITWTLGKTYEDMSASVHDVVWYQWAGTHSLWMMPDGNCPTSFTEGNGYEMIMEATADSHAYYHFETPGTYWFACSLPGHCDGGMKIKWTVT